MAQTISHLTVRLRIKRPWAFSLAAVIGLPAKVCGWLGGMTTEVV